MRALLVLIGILILVLAALMILGFINIDQTRPGRAPSVSVQGGQMPAFDADVGSVGVGTVNKTVTVPTVSVTPAANTAAVAQ